MEFPKNKFYSGDVQSVVPHLANPIPIFNKEKPIIFININGQEKQLGNSLYNMEEIEAIKQFYAHLKKYLKINCPN